MFTIETTAHYNATADQLTLTARCGSEKVTTRLSNYNAAESRAAVHMRAAGALADKLGLSGAQRNFIGLPISYEKMLWVSETAATKAAL